MNVVIDGDSVAKLRPDNWPALFADRYHVKVTCLASDEAKTPVVMDRLPKAFAASPDLYILQLGQWSYHNEERAAFFSGMSHIISAVHDKGVPVVLCTPTHMAPPEHPDKWTVEVIHDLSMRYNTGLVDFYHRMLDAGADESWFLPQDLGTKWVCHLNARGSREAVTYFDRIIQPYEVSL